jgi:hypothetical protein
MRITDDNLPAGVTESTIERAYGTGRAVSDLDTGEVIDLAMEVLADDIADDMALPATYRGSLRRTLAKIEALQDPAVWDPLTTVLLPKIEALLAEREQAAAEDGPEHDDRD